MKKNNLFKLCCFFVCWAIPSAVGEGENKENQKEQTSSDSVLDKIDTVEAAVDKITQKTKWLRSKRGIKVLFMNDDTAPLVHIRLAFKNCGAAYQKKEEAAIPDFYSRTVFEGCGKFSSTEFQKAVSDIMTSLNCESTPDIVKFTVCAPKVVLDEAANLLNVALKDPKYEKDKVQNVKDNMLLSMQNYANLGTLQYNEIPAILFDQHPYGHGQGTAEDLAKLSIEDIKKFKDKFIVAKNAEVCIFGDISEDKAIQIVDRIFENIKDGSAASDNIPDVEPQLSSIRKNFYSPGPQSYILFALPCAKPNSRDEYASNVALTVFGGNVLKSKIYSILRMKLGYIYSGGARLTYRKHACYILGGLSTDNKKVDKAIAAFKDIIKDLRQNGLTQEDLDFAKGNIKGSTLMNLRFPGALCNYYSGRMLFGVNPDSLAKKLKGIKRMTLKKLNDYCGRFFDENKVVFVVVGGNAK